MPKVMPANWKSDAIAAFLRGELVRHHFERLVELGLMSRQSGEKSTVRRGRNPIEYRLTPAGWDFAGQTPRDVVVSTDPAAVAAALKVESKPVPTEPAAKMEPQAEPVKPVPEPVRIEAEPVIDEPVPRLSPDELAAIEAKPRITKAERTAYFANVNWNVQFDRPETAGYDSSMPAFLDRRHPVWQKIHSQG